MIRSALPWLVSASVILVPRLARADAFDDWRSSGELHPERPGGEDDNKKKKKKDEKKADPKESSTPSSPSAEDAAALATKLASLGLPFGLSLFGSAGATARAGAGAASGASSIAAAGATSPGAAAVGAVKPPAGSGLLPGAPGGATPAVPGASGGGGGGGGGSGGGGLPGFPSAASGVGGAAPSGVGAVGGVGPAAPGVAGLPVAAAGGAAAVPAGGATSLAAAAPIAGAASTAVALPSLHIAANGAVLIGPGDALALSPRTTELLAATFRGELTSAAEAQELAQAGERMLATGNVDMACGMLEQALTAQRTTANLFALSRCYERAGRLATAWVGYTALASVDGEASVRGQSAAGAQRLAPGLSRLRFAMVVAPGTKPPAVFVDDRAVARDHWGKSLPADPGQHVVVVRAEGQPDWTQQVNIPRDPQESVVHWPQPTTPQEAPSGRPWYISGRVLVGGIATAVLAGGATAAAFWMLSARSDFNARNGQPGAGAAELNDLHDTARFRGNVTNVLYGAAGVGLVLTTIFAIADSKTERPPSAAAGVRVVPWAGRDGGGLSIGGKL